MKGSGMASDCLPSLSLPLLTPHSCSLGPCAPDSQPCPIFHLFWVKTHSGKVPSRHRSYSWRVFIRCVDEMRDARSETTEESLDGEKGESGSHSVASRRNSAASLAVLSHGADETRAEYHTEEMGRLGRGSTDVSCRLETPPLCVAHVGAVRAEIQSVLCTTLTRP